MELDPNFAMAQNNLALGLVSLKQFDEAKTAARSALRLDPASVPARYALGLASLGLNECTADALAQLRVAEKAFPRAFLSAAQMRVCQGDIDGAIEDLNAYLGQPNAPEQQRAEAWLAVLRAQAK